MKTTPNRIHRKVKVKPPSIQPKIQPAKSAAPNVTIDKAIDFSLQDELDSAVAQSHALHWLLADVLTIGEGGVYGDQTQDGITELIISTHDRMDRAAKSVEALLLRNREVAA